MGAFACYLPKIEFGEGTLSKIGQLAARLGTKAMLTIDPFLDKQGLSREIVGMLENEGVSAVIGTDITPNPDCFRADNGGKTAREERCDMVVAVGGGSALDYGKAVAVVAKNEGKAWQFTERQDHTVLRPDKVLPVIAVPTTAGTGSEATPFSVLNNPQVHEKSTIVSDKIMPACSIVDPVLTYSMPAQLTAYTGIDVLAHAIEAFISVHSTPYGKLTALEAIRLVSRWLPEAVANGGNVNARRNMAWASVLGGSAIAYIGVALPHTLGQPVGGLKGAPHGAAVAACLVKVMEVSYTADFDKFAAVAEALDGSVASLPLHARAEQSAVLVERLFRDVGVKVRYRDFGVTEEDIDKLVHTATTSYSFDLCCHPKQMDEASLKALYRECL